VNSTGSLATRSDDASDPPGVGVTHNGCTDDDDDDEEEEEEEEEDWNNDEADEEGMDDVWA